MPYKVDRDYLCQVGAGGGSSKSIGGDSGSAMSRIPASESDCPNFNNNFLLIPWGARGPGV